MQMNNNDKWILEKAKQEDGCIVSTGGIVSKIKKRTYLMRKFADVISTIRIRLRSCLSRFNH